MTYGDLFQLNEITSVIQIDQANSEEGARNLVSRFVITSSLAESIDGIAIPQLNFESGVEGKGIFLVGNYGTGKSHVMSFLSILAEDKTMLDLVADEAWRSKLAAFAGKYVVIRQDIVVSDKSVTLFQIVCNALEELVRKSGFVFEFKRTGVDNIKKEFARFMVEFERVHHDKGALLVIDEVLDFLRQRDSSERVGDLSTCTGSASGGKNDAFVRRTCQSRRWTTFGRLPLVLPGLFPCSAPAQSVSAKKCAKCMPYGLAKRNN